MAKAAKSRVSKQAYISPNQLTLVGFESPFSNHLNPANRWVTLSRKIPGDVLVNGYQKQLNNSQTGADGINALETVGILKKTAPDVILLDINLPGINEIDVLKYIKKNHLLTKVLIVTNYSEDEYRDACLKIGAEYFIGKSTEFENIPVSVEKIVCKKAAKPLFSFF